MHIRYRHGSNTRALCVSLESSLTSKCDNPSPSFHHKFREVCKSCSGYIISISPSVPSLYVPPACEASFASSLHNFIRHRRLCQFSFRSALLFPVLSICSSFLLLLFQVWFLPEYNFSRFFSHVGCSIQCPFPTSLHISKKQYTYLLGVFRK